MKAEQEVELAKQPKVRAVARQYMAMGGGGSPPKR